ncbi:MAG: hypothetical protein QM756_12210 [Polyangiaceae bacterium]
MTSPVGQLGRPPQSLVIDDVAVRQVAPRQHELGLAARVQNALDQRVRRARLEVE